MNPAKYQEIYKELHGELPPSAVECGESEAAILRPGRGFMAAFDLTMQLQVGCPGACLFCYVPSGGTLTPREIKGPQGKTWGFRVQNKTRVEQKLIHALESKQLADKTVYWSGVTDPYAAKPVVTRNVWQILSTAAVENRPRRLVVQTRFRPDRDIDLISKYCETSRPSDGGPAVLFSISVGTDRDDLIRAWERATPRFESRLASIEKLRNAGLWVVATLSPFGLWNDLQGTVGRFKTLGVAYLTVLFLKEKTTYANTPPLFLQYLRETCPEVLNPSWQSDRLAEIRAVYDGDRIIVGQQAFVTLASPHTVGSSRLDRALEL